MNDLNFTTEEEFEHYLIELGQQAFQDQVDKAKGKVYYSSTQPARYLFQEWIQTYCDVLVTTNAEAMDMKRSRNNIQKSAKLMNDVLEELSPITTAVIGFKTILDFYCQDRPMTAASVAKTIGSRVEDEIRFKYYHDNFNTKDQKTIERWSKRSGADPRNRREAVKHISQTIASANNLKQWLPWSTQQQAGIGLYLLEVAYQLDMIDWKNTFSNKKQQKMIYANRLIDKLEGWYEDIHRGAFKNYPLLFEPRKWEVLDTPSRYNNTGGHHNPELRRRLFMARSFESDSWFGEKAVDLLNNLQAVAWRIDNRVLNVAKHFRDKRINLGSLIVPPFDRPTKGGAPQHVVDDPVLLKKWRDEVSGQHEIYNDYHKKSIRTNESIRLAEIYKLKTFYLPWSLDYRSRFYTQQAWLQPQATDLEKALLMFWDGCKVKPDSDAERACKQAIGAAFNGSRISYQEREKWTDEN